MKKALSLILVCLMLAPMFCFETGAVAAALEANTVAVDLALTGADGSDAEITVGDKTYAVKVGETGFNTLQAAFDAVPAGGTVLLAAGEYTENNVQISKDVTVLGPKAGIDPNVKGATPTDDWTRNPLRGSGEAVIKANWHMGVRSNSTVYDCHAITLDGVAISGTGMLRSNVGAAGYITLTYKNILVIDSAGTSASNGPFYCYSYYPNRTTNDYVRDVIAENIRFENHNTCPAFNLDVDTFTATGLYFDAACKGKLFQYAIAPSYSASQKKFEITIKDSMFCQKTNQIINANFKTNADSTSMNATIGQRESATLTVENCVFKNNDSKATSNNNIIVPQTNVENTRYIIKNNIFIQENASANFIAIHGAVSAGLDMNAQVSVTGNRFIGIPTALSMSSSTPFDLSGNYFAADGVTPTAPVVGGESVTKWWYMDYDFTLRSDAMSATIDGKPVGGEQNAEAKTVVYNTDKKYLELDITTENFNIFKLYSDAELKNELTNPVHLFTETTEVYIKIMTNDEAKHEVWRATIKTSDPDKLAYNLDSEVLWFGRTYSDNGAYFFNWSASGFSFNFKGTGATATFVSSDANDQNDAFLKVYVDGVEQEDIRLTSTSHTVVLAKDLDPEKTHRIRVEKRTNARSSSAALTELVLADGGIKLEPDTKREKLIEFIGDSLTVGYATLATASSTAWSTSTEDCSKTYTKQIADYFGADYNVIAISGRGIVRNTGGDTDKLMGVIYPEVDLYNDPGKAYGFERQPDAIVINLGTNDASGNNGSLTAAEFKAGLKTFLKQVREKNPNAEIIYAYGLTTKKWAPQMQEVIAELNAEGDNKISFLELKICIAKEMYLSHTKAEAYETRGNQIIEVIEQKLGWAKDTTAYTDPEFKPIGGTAEPEVSTGATDTEPVTPPDNSEVVTDPVVTEPEDEGCGSAVAGALATVAAIGAAGVMIKKKKED